MYNTKKLTVISLLISLALTLHVFEQFLPVPLPIPGVKLGLANVITLLTIILFGFKEAIIVVFCRTLLGSFLGGTPSSFIFSIVGSLLSAFIMTLLYKKYLHTFSLPTISILGAVFHNLGQIFVASLIFSSINIFYYFPLLIFSGIITGFFIGLTTKHSLKYLPITSK